jgi:hypothetical protein
MEVLSRRRQKYYSSNLCVQTGPGAHSASCKIESKARPRSGADHSPPPSTEFMNEYELYLISPCASMLCSGATLPNMVNTVMLSELQLYGNVTRICCVDHSTAYRPSVCVCVCVCVCVRACVCSCARVLYYDLCLTTSLQLTGAVH